MCIVHGQFKLTDNKYLFRLNLSIHIIYLYNSIVIIS